MCIQEIVEQKKEDDEIRSFIEMIQKSTRLSYERAYLFHLEMWVLFTGATMLAVVLFLRQMKKQ